MTSFPWDKPQLLIQPNHSVKNVHEQSNIGIISEMVNDFPVAAAIPIRPILEMKRHNGLEIVQPSHCLAEHADLVTEQEQL